jgi:site-specific recombinase XerD
VFQGDPIVNHQHNIPSFEDYVLNRRYIRNVSQDTLDWYENAWRAFGPHVEPALPSDLSTGLIKGIQTLRERGVKAVSINSYLTCVRAYVNWLWAEGHLTTKPKVTLLKEEKRIIETLSPAQCHALVSHRPRGVNASSAHLVACVVLDCGLRISEALGLTWDKIDLDNCLLRVFGKGSKERSVPISTELRKRLFKWKLAHRNVGDFAFGTRTRTQVTVRNFQRDLAFLGHTLRIEGVRFSPHTLRHTFAINYLRAGGNLFYLSRILGHTSIKTTERYLQSVGVEDLQAVHSQLSLLSARTNR